MPQISKRIAQLHSWIPDGVVKHVGWVVVGTGVVVVVVEVVGVVGDVEGAVVVGELVDSPELVAGDVVVVVGWVVAADPCSVDAGAVVVVDVDECAVDGPLR